MQVFTGVKADPITGQNISTRCWNGYHEDGSLKAKQVCESVGCNCLCHHKEPWPRIAN